MPTRDDSGAPADGSGADRQERPSRRSVLRGAAGAGAAGIAVAALSGVAAPALAAAAQPARAGAADAETAPRTADADTADQIVVHVRDARSGQIDVFRGTSQTSLRDADLAARLVRASRQ